VLIGGLPGTGKSALAVAAADRFGYVVLNSDRIRKELAGVPPESGAAVAYGTGIYTPAWTERCYAELLHRAGALLASGESVIADASWLSAPQRAAAAALAGDASAELVQLRCAASADLARQRICARHHGVSDADAEVARRMAADMAPWPQATTIDTESGGPGTDAEPPGAFGDLVRQALDAIRPHGPQHVWRPSRPVMLPD
jgi:predicted kinase